MTPPSAPHPFAPDEVLPPGDTLKEQLDALGIPQADLARRTGLSTKHINQIVQGGAVLTPETALLLERAVGIPASLWNQMEAAWRTHVSRTQSREALSHRLDWLDRFSLQELVKRGILPTKERTVDNLERLLAFFGVADPEVAENVWGSYRTAFRRSTVLTPDDYATAVWLRQAELRAREIPCAPYDRAALLELLPQLRALTVEEPAVWRTEIPRLCAQAGVAMVFVAAPPNSRVSGVTRWLTPEKVGVALSGRFKKDDHFWFTVFHELGHVLLHGKRLTFIDNTSRDDDTTPEGDRSEDEADAFARETLIPPEHAAAYKQLAQRPMPFTNITAFARRAGIAPGIVVGRLQHDGVLDWKYGSKLKRPIEISLSGDLTAG
ncbi:ImmA/IrrE family metallo-endopeptidase [Streptomyces sp. H28]|uniref:ImmA/IrrE family metallo-endopeptidase n=1 Tax=Streptomyces sp. H28 TaxID=2775865 RepID=UPI00177A89E4|nr:ImmA/IrrE family metallo-endopeptidase [Streptomyces sp. H28]MBD9730259.1 ImmA/IrrE family metallo-endopeptidase [Streptomyces sp. H28]